MNITSTSTTPCRYCGEPVHADYDAEPGGRDDTRWYFPYGGAHFWECICERPEGEWAVVTWNTGAPEGSPWREPHTRRFTTQQRAREVAADTRRNNLREWPCGRNLEIRVRRIAVSVG